MDVNEKPAPEESKPIQINTPEGPVTAHKSTVEPTPQKITKVTGNELKRLESLGAGLSEFISAYLPDNAAEHDLKTLDRAFRAWQTSDSKKHTKEQVIELLGGYLGNKLVADLGMEWVIVRDEYGTDYAVRSAKTEVMGFPFSTVMKRIEDDEHSFLFGVYYTVKQTIDEAADRNN